MRVRGGIGGGWEGVRLEGEGGISRGQSERERVLLCQVSREVSQSFQRL